MSWYHDIIMKYLRNEIELGAAVRAARHLRKMTQAELATKARVSRSFIITLERGQGPRAEIGRVLRVLKALGFRLTLEEDTTPDFAQALQQLLDRD
jgi:transcriptional regulator with XRE-family HTH domain